jgi:hypothetical protein
MVLPWFGVLVDRNADPEKILAIRQDACTAAAALPAAPALPGPVPAIPRLALPTVEIFEDGR